MSMSMSMLLLLISSHVESLKMFLVACNNYEYFFTAFYIIVTIFMQTNQPCEIGKYHKIFKNSS